MKVTLTYNGVVDITKYERGTVLDLPKNSNAIDVMELCEIRKEHQPFIVPFINGEEARAKTELHEGDELSLFLPLGGG